MGCTSQLEKMLVKAEDLQKVKEEDLQPPQLRKLFHL
jgi:hypothetical protein